METKKYIFFFLTLIVALAVSSFAIPDVHSRQVRASGNKSHHLIVGTRQPGDGQVLKENIVKESKWMRVVVVEKTFNATRYKVITQVAAYDQKTNGNGAFASLTGGGPGYNYVKLRFKSQRGHGINFSVELYAR